jgi:hypothetical protein
MRWPAQDAYRLLMDITASPSSRKVVVAHDAIRSREEPTVKCLDGAQNQGEIDMTHCSPMPGGLRVLPSRSGEPGLRLFGFTWIRLGLDALALWNPVRWR